MKQLMRSLLVPAVAGALFAGPALADPRDVLTPNKSQHGSIVRTTWTAGEAPASIAGRNTDVRHGLHAQTQAQMAAMQGATEEGSENAAINDKQNKKTSSEKQNASAQRIAHPKGGDDTAESMTNVKDSCGKTKRCNKDGEKLHFSANQAQQLSGGGEKPADMGSNSKSQKQPSSQQTRDGSATQPADKIAVAHHESEKFKAPTKRIAEGKPDMPNQESREAKSAPESRADRFISMHAAGSLAAHHESSHTQMRMPDKFYH